MICPMPIEVSVRDIIKNYELLKTGLNNVVLPIFLIVVNNIEQVVEPESSPQSGVTVLNNIVDIIEQCGQHNIVQSCFQQPVTTYNFWLCTLYDPVHTVPDSCGHDIEFGQFTVIFSLTTFFMISFY